MSLNYLPHLVHFALTSNNVESLQATHKAAKRKLDELKETGDDAWEDLKAGMENAWSDLSNGVKSAMSRFK